MKRLLSLFLALSVILTLTAFTVNAQEKTEDTVGEAVPVITIDYTNKFNGTVDGKKTAIFERNFDLGGRKVLLVTPNTENPNHTRIVLDCYNLEYPGSLLAQADYATVEYMYLTPPEVNGYSGKMMLSLLSNGKALKKSYDLNAMNGMIKDKWTTAVFDLSKIKADINPDGKFVQFHLYPYGYSRDPENMHPGEMMYIGNVTFWKGKPPIEYPPEKPAGPPVIEKPSSEGPLVFKIDYGTACQGIVDGKKTAVITKKYTEDGKSCVKAVPSPDTANHMRIGLDCYNIEYPGLYVAEANYLEVDYKYICPEGVPGAKGRKMTISLMSNGGALRSTVDINSVGTVSAGDGWKTMVFDLTTSHEKVDIDAVFKQFHFFPFGYSTDPKSLSEDEIMYIGEMRFLREIPEGEQTNDIFSFNYSDQNNGLVDGGNTATLTKDAVEDGVRSLKVVPNTVDPQKTNINLDCYSINYPASQLKDARFITVKYKYVCPDGVEGQNVPMWLSILKNGGAVKETIEFKSVTPLEKNVWTTATFNINSISKVLTGSGSFKQMHLRPFGQSTNPAKMNPGEAIFIENITFYRQNPDRSSEYTVTFMSGHPKATGEDPAPLTVKNKDEITLPENPYSFENGMFFGWQCSYDEKIYPAGHKMEAYESSVVYTAQFKDMSAAPETVTVKLSDFASGIANSKDTAKLTKAVDFDGHTNVVMLEFNPATKNPDDDVVIDGHQYEPAGIDLSAYKYAVVNYYFDGNLGDRKPKMLLGLLKNGGALKTSVYCESAEPIKSGAWEEITIDVSKAIKNINPNTTNHTLKQMHVYCGTGYKAKDFKEGEKLYIDTITFFRESPDLGDHSAYMKGYDGGLFKPQGNMTRAEACTIVARLSAGGDANVPSDKATAFSDVTADGWYYKYVSYVESLGYLKSYSGNFLPDKAITRAEFVELVYNMGLLSDKGLNGTFTDVAEDHKRASVISAAGKAGLVNGYDNGDGTFSFRPDNTITRAEVVKVINNAYGRSIAKDGLAKEVNFIFIDVEPDFWAFADICEATVDHSETGGKWVKVKTNLGDLLGGDARLDFEAGKNYVAELDRISEEKKAAIRNTPTTVNVSGTKYYVSTSGSDANDGLTPETAWATVGKVSKFEGFKAGDGVFFRRGDIWREKLSAQSGVTYSAYGEGAKPTFYGSPENGTGAEKWTLVEGTENIWQYHRKMLDVGLILVDGKADTVKNCPDLLKDSKYYVRGKAELFDIKTHLADMEFFTPAPRANYKTTEVELYFRCDRGNPGEIFSSIEFLTIGNIIQARSNVTIDNLCLMYGGTHGIGSSTAENLTVTNCEIGWIGGSLQQYDGGGKIIRLGNGVEIYGGCDGYTIENCYIYQCYDAGVTHQYSEGGTENISMYNILYKDNLIEDCIYSIEYFTGAAVDTAVKRDGKNYRIAGNILRRAGYGWGVQRWNDVNAHIKGWNSRNEYEPGTFVIENNIMDRATYMLVQTGAMYDEWCPVYSGNTYVQVLGRRLGYHTDAIMYYDNIADMTVKYSLGDKNAKVYFVKE